MANRFDNGTKKEKKEVIGEQLTIDTAGADLSKKTQIMLRLDPVLGAQVKAKAKSKGLPATKYIELLIREDLEK